MPNKTLDLTKIKLGKSVVLLTYLDFVIAGDDIYEKEVTEKCKAPPTADFKAAIRKIKDYVYKLHPLEAKKVESLDVTQIIIKPEDDGMGITLSVTVQFKDVSRPSNFNTPYASTLDNSNPLPDAVVEIIDVIKDQAKQYSEGRYEQASLELDNIKNPNEETKTENANDAPEKQKRGRSTNSMKKAREEAEQAEAEEAETAEA